MCELLKKTFQIYQIGVTARKIRKVNPEHQSNAKQILAGLMGNARGLTMKVGQFMAGNFDDNEFKELVNTIQPLPLKEVVPLIEQRSGKTIHSMFKTIDESRGAASIGQVHHAQLLDGNDVAIKVRYPGIVKSIKAEMKLFSLLPDVGPVKRWKFNSLDYKNTLCRQLLRETDYLLEMQTQQRFLKKLNIPGLVIPKVYPELSSETLLVQSWEDGYRFNEACNWSKKERLEIARILLTTVFQGLFVHGEIHADPHVGNYLFRQNDQGQTETVLLDYGCSAVIDKTARLALLKLMIAFQSRTHVDPFPYFVAMGFDADKLSHIYNKLPELCHILFLPFINQKSTHAKFWPISKPMKALLEEQRWWFRAAGPADLFLLIRTFHALKQQMVALDVALPWWPMLKFAVGEDVLQQARLFSLPKVKAIHLQTPIKITAKKLCVQVVENDTTLIDLDLPAETVLDLESYIPDSVIHQIRKHEQVDLIQLTKKLRRNEIKPQTIYQDHRGVKNLHVWLE